MSQPRHLVVMGVTATGKTTVGRALAEAIGGVFVEGDTFHPPANIEKMSAGIPLGDDDRRRCITEPPPLAPVDGAPEHRAACHFAGEREVLRG